MTRKISRSQWDQIEKRVRQVDFQFDPDWKCLLDGIAWNRCYEHTEDDQEFVISEVRKRIGVV